MTQAPADLDIVTSGILWAVNEFLLWPAGIALLVTGDTDDQGRRFCTVVATDPAESIVDDAIAADGSDRAAAFALLLRGRLERLPVLEREPAEARLRWVLAELGGQTA